MSWLWQQGTQLAKDVKHTVRRLSTKDFSAAEMKAQLEEEATAVAKGDFANLEIWVQGLTVGADEAERFEGDGAEFNMLTFRQIFFGSRALEIFILAKAKQRREEKNLLRYENLLALCFVSDWQELVIPLLDMEISSPDILKVLEDIVTALKPASAVENLEDVITLIGLEIQNLATKPGNLFHAAELEVARAEAASQLADARKAAAVSKSRILKELAKKDLSDAENKMHAESSRASEAIAALKNSAELMASECQAQLQALEPVVKQLDLEISSLSEEAGNCKGKIVDAEKRLAAATEEKSALKRKLAAEREKIFTEERGIKLKEEEISRSIEAVAERRQLLMNTRASVQVATDMLRNQVPAKISRSEELAVESLREYLVLMKKEFIDDDIGIHEHPEQTPEMLLNFQVFLTESKPYLEADAISRELAAKLTHQFKLEV